MTGKMMTQKMSYIFTSGNMRYIFTGDLYKAYFMQSKGLDGYV